MEAQYANIIWMPFLNRHLFFFRDMPHHSFHFAKRYENCQHANSAKSNSQNGLGRLFYTKNVRKKGLVHRGKIFTVTLAVFEEWKRSTQLKVDFSVHAQDLINFPNIKIGLCGVCIQYTHVFFAKNVLY